MRVIVAMPGEPAVVKRIENTLESLQEIVGGYIETAPLWLEDLVLICNEEGKLRGMAPNRAIGHDIIVGPIIVAKANNKTGEFEDVPEFVLKFLCSNLDKRMIREE